MQPTIKFGIAVVPAGLLLILLLMVLYWLTLGRQKRKLSVAFCTALVVMVIVVWRLVGPMHRQAQQTVMFPPNTFPPNMFHATQAGPEAFWIGLCFFVGLGGLVMALWSSWGLAGWQNWLRWRAAMWSAVMAVGLAPLLDGDTLLMFLLGLVPFAVGAAICGGSAGGRAPAAGMAMGGAATSGGQSDRERVLGLLERGAISGDEAAELLAAMGEKQRETGGGLVGTRLLWVGAALVAMGFFLPWASIDVGKMMGDMQAGMMQGMPAQGWSGFGPMQVRTTSSMTVNGQPVAMPPGYMNNPGVPMPPPGYPMGNSFSSDGPTVLLHAADLGHGLGWVVLALALTAGLLPQFREFRRKPAETRRMVLAALVGIGLLLSLYLGSQLVKYAQAGLLLNIAGYLLMAVAVAREWRSAAAEGNR